jgi:nicotinate-nucleotide adenylyltransferase
MKLGILGGTFDPIHIGHLVLAESCWDFFGLDKIVFIPAKIPPHKMNRDITSEQFRYEMIKIAISNYKHFELSNVELNRTGPSYTVDTVQNLITLGQIFLLMGHDSFLEIESWHKYQVLFSICKIIVVIRPGFESFLSDEKNRISEKYPLLKTVDLTKDKLHSKTVSSADWDICFFPIPGLAISATEIRKKVFDHKSIRFLVPESVQNYIYEHKLYASSQ